MLKANFLASFEPEIAQEISKLPPHGRAENINRRDMRNSLWSSIDNSDSQDLDQIEYAEKIDGGDVKLYIGIADVDAFVPAGSATDKHAGTNTTSIYTGVINFPMLPDELSYKRSSLLKDQDRKSIVVEMVLDSNGNCKSSSVYATIVRNHAKLDYATIGKWLLEQGDEPDQVSGVDGLKDQLLFQNQLTERIHALRKNAGALHLQTQEITPVLDGDDIVGLALVDENPARELIENFMIVANIATTRFLEEKKLPSLRRVVKTPERWSKIVEVAKGLGFNLSETPDAKSLSQFLTTRRQADPSTFPDLSLTIVKLLGSGEYVVAIPGQPDEGHFALAVHDYTHATAPNRRYPDLVTQRLVKAALQGLPNPYSTDELQQIAAQCTEREHAAKKVERTMHKVAAAVFLGKHIGEHFDGIVTGVKDDAVYVRLFKPPAEGRIIRNAQGLDVGDKVKLQLVSTDPEQAFIDFARIR
jgi:exoribonuclease-2